MVQWNTRVYHNSELEWTAEHCCICIPGRACVERFVTCLRPAPSKGPKCAGSVGVMDCTWAPPELSPHLEQGTQQVVASGPLIAQRVLGSLVRRDPWALFGEVIGTPCICRHEPGRSPEGESAGVKSALLYNVPTLIVCSCATELRQPCNCGGGLPLHCPIFTC